MHKFILVFGLITGLLLSGFGFDQGSEGDSGAEKGTVQRYELDPAHTNIEFAVRHMLLTKVKGQFNDVMAELKWDGENLDESSVEVRIKTASIDTDNERRDNHLRSADFLDAEKYPEIIFKSDRIEKTEDGHIAHGKLTIRDVTRDVSLPFKVMGKLAQPDGRTRIGFEATLTINRFDYNVNWDKVLETGGLVAGEDVEIDIQAQFVSAEES